MRHKINIRGSLVPNDYKFYYDFFGEDSTCPRDVYTVLDAVSPGDEVDVYINSPGGVIDVGSEIYTRLKKAAEIADVKIYIVGEACSAASVVACAAYCEMAPTALMMVHCVSTCGCGNHSDFEHTAEVLRTADRALCTAYTAKTGMTEDEALEMMEHETWLTAEQAKEKGLVDAIMFKQEEPSAMVASGVLFTLPTADQMDKIRALVNEDPQEGDPEKEPDEEADPDEPTEDPNENPVEEPEEPDEPEKDPDEELQDKAKKLALINTKIKLMNLRRITK